ncbi:MAG: pyridine nucleotide-disulfide oxidoreductase [Aquificaceae bacterium]|nr:MAG: pyridine nucleotide-disulfide oxidoreductase [Aquificaceae bacterium]
MDKSPQPPSECDVAIIGGGPSGLAAATELKKLGVNSVVILEREAEAGGIPRHCAHSPFGMREFKRVYNGANYTLKLSQRAMDQGVVICLNTSVIALHKHTQLTLSTPHGVQTLHAKKVIICTGIRETPRAKRLVSGQRPLGIMTTGALQSMISLKHKRPFKQPIIIGTELVSFSALLSCRSAGIRPIAMLEKNARITAKYGTQILAKVLGIPIYYESELSNIIGKHHVNAVDIVSKKSSFKNRLQCDGVIFTGQFIAESSLLSMSHLKIDPHSANPIIDQFGRCSDSDYFATGNMTHPVETAGYCWSNGIKTAQLVYASLKGRLDCYQQHARITSASADIKYIIPQTIAISSKKNELAGINALQIRVNKALKGRLSIRSGEKILVQKNINTLPERRVELALPELVKNDANASLQLYFESG